MGLIHSVIAATGSCVPAVTVLNQDFNEHRFLNKDGSVIPTDNLRNIEKFREISGIGERRYAADDQRASDLAVLSAREALSTGNIDPESLDYIIVAHNFGDVTTGSNRTDMVPSLASRVKYQLQIKNPGCIAYDLVFGCPGWLQGMIQADYYIRSGDAKRCLIIGTETLSRVVDPSDRDSMLYADGSGAMVLEASSEPGRGILAHGTHTYASDQALLLTMGKSYDSTDSSGNIFLKMNGRALYEFALTHVPQVVKSVLDKAGVDLLDVKKVLIHQANEKMDHAILQRLFKLYNLDSFPAEIMPMTISWLGNSSVATLPTLLSLLRSGKIEGQQINDGDKVVFASVGAGMNINALLYQY